MSIELDLLNARNKLRDAWSEISLADANLEKLRNVESAMKGTGWTIDSINSDIAKLRSELENGLKYIGNEEVLTSISLSKLNDETETTIEYYMKKEIEQIKREKSNQNGIRGYLEKKIEDLLKEGINLDLDV